MRTLFTLCIVFISATAHLGHSCAGDWNWHAFFPVGISSDARYMVGAYYTLTHNTQVDDTTSYSIEYPIHVLSPQFTTTHTVELSIPMQWHYDPKNETYDGSAAIVIDLEQRKVTEQHKLPTLPFDELYNRELVRHGSTAIIADGDKLFRKLSKRWGATKNQGLERLYQSLLTNKKLKTLLRKYNAQNTIHRVRGGDPTTTIPHWGTLSNRVTQEKESNGSMRDDAVHWNLRSPKQQFDFGGPRHPFAKAESIAMQYTTHPTSNAGFFQLINFYFNSCHDHIAWDLWIVPPATEPTKP